MMATSLRPAMKSSFSLRFTSFVDTPSFVRRRHRTFPSRPRSILPAATGGFSHSLILSRRFPTCVRLPTYPVRKPILSLDRIYLSADWELTDAAVFRDGLAQQASDHLPLVAQARLIA